VPTSDRLRHVLLYPVRTPRRGLLIVLLLAAAGGLAWYGERTVRFRREYAAAEQALARYDFPLARERLRECLRLRPDDPGVRLLAAQAARRDGDLDEAEEHLDRYRELAGSTPEGVLERALLLSARGRVQEVVEYLIPLADSGHPSAEQILEALAVGCVHLYRLDQASVWTHFLLKVAPGNPVGLLVRGQTAATLNNRDQAVETFRRLVDEHPNFAKGRLALAQALDRVGRYEEALSHYEVLQKQLPGDPVPLLGQARCLDRLGRTEEARPLIRDLGAQYADNSEVLLECGRFALRDGRPADAEHFLRRAAELAPNDHEVRLQLGITLEQLGRPDEARPHLARAAEIEADLMLLEKAVAAMVRSPADPAPRLEAGQVCLRNGYDGEGLRWLYGALEIAPDHKPTHQALADYFAARGDAHQADWHRQKAR
jgi:Flp pilus assembly protein TadD